MGGKFVKSEASYSFALYGDNQVDAELLSEVIHNFAQLTKQTVNVESPEIYIKLNVTAFRQGSFIVDFSTICEAQNLLTGILPQTVSLAKNVVETIKGFFEVKKFLNGEKPQSIEKTGTSVCIRNNNGQVLNAPEGSIRILENAQIDNLVLNICHDVQSSGSNGFSLSSGSGQSIFSLDDIQSIKKPISSEREIYLKSMTIEAFLPIKKLDIMGNSAWEFRYNDHSIRALMEDENWLQEVQTGKISFKSGDALYAQLEIIMELDENKIPIDGTEKYVVKRVLEHIHDSEQTTLF